MGETNDAMLHPQELTRLEWGCYHSASMATYLLGRNLPAVVGDERMKNSKKASCPSSGVHGYVYLSTYAKERKKQVTTDKN